MELRLRVALRLRLGWCLRVGLRLSVGLRLMASSKYFLILFSAVLGLGPSSCKLAILSLSLISDVPATPSSSSSSPDKFSESSLPDNVSESESSSSDDVLESESSSSLPPKSLLPSDSGRFWSKSKGDRCSTSTASTLAPLSRSFFTASSCRRETARSRAPLIVS